jgi:predicted ATPase
MEETQQVFPILYGLWIFYIVQADYKTASALSEQLLNLAQRQQDRIFLIEAHWAFGCSSFFLGNFAPGQEHLGKCLELYDPLKHASLAFEYGHDPAMSSLCYSALTLLRLGYPDQALKRGQEALTWARKLHHPFSLGYALTNVALLHLLRREEDPARQLTEELLELSAGQEFTFLLAAGTIFYGNLLVAQGKEKEGIAQLYKGIIDYKATGAGLYVPYFLTLLAEVCGKVERIEEGLQALAEALTMGHQTGERHHEAEQYRLKGEMLLRRIIDRTSKDGVSPAALQTEAETCFHQALEVARQQQARLWELRAAMSLSRLWKQQGKQKQAKQMLAEIYGWFSEGFETRDLNEARTLLAELTGERLEAVSSKGQKRPLSTGGR